MKKENQEETLFPKKFAKVLESIPEFKDAADAASTEDLKKIIVTCENNIWEIDKSKDSDMALNAARELVKEHSQPHREAARVQTCKIKYAIFLLEGRGVNLNK